LKSGYEHILFFLCFQEKKLEIYNAIVKLQKGDESDEKLQVCIFALLIYFLGYIYAIHLFPDHIFPLFIGAG
jgi:hypothetical protein